jgi:hypothetical protein
MALPGQLVITFKPAFYALIECASAIALEDGDEAATAWAHRVIAADLTLFSVSRVERRPQLRLIQGGR